jgi:hypothetical protein
LAASFIFPRPFLGHRAFTLNRRVGDQLPTCQMIFDVIGDLIAHGGQLKQFGFNDRIVGLLGKFRPILERWRPP